MITIPFLWKRWWRSSFCFNNFDTNGKMGKWRGNEYSIVFIDAQNFHRTISFINKMFTDFYHGKYIKSSRFSEDDVQIFVAEMQYIFSDCPQNYIKSNHIFHYHHTKTNVHRFLESRKFQNLFSEIFHFRNIPTKMI